MRGASSGMTGVPASGSACGPLPRETTTAAITARSVIPSSQARVFPRIPTPLRRRARLPLAPPHAQDAEADRRQADKDRHQRDIEELRPSLQPVDVLAQRELHLAQLAADLDHVGAEIVERLLLLRRQRDARTRALLAQLLDLVLGLLELGLETFLGRLVARIRDALDVVDELERPCRGAAAPEADEIVAPRKHIDRIGDEVAIVGDRDGHGLAEEILALHPEPVLENVGVRNENDVDRLGRG